MALGDLFGTGTESFMRVQVVLLLLAAGWTFGPLAPEPLVLVSTIELPNVDGRIDHLACDVATGRIFVAALGNNTVEVVDGRAGRHVRSLGGFHEPQGIALAADANVVAVANGASGDVTMIGRTDFALIRTVPLGEDPDNVRYDAAEKRLFVGYGSGSGAIAGVDAAGGQRVGEVKLAGHPESFQLEREGPRIFVNVPTAHHIAVIDRAARKLLTTWPVTDASSNYPMAVDHADHRLFVGCRQPATVLIYDTASGKRVASVETVGDTDDLFYDAARKRLYVSGGEGYIDVFQQSSPDQLTRIVKLKTAAGARTSLFVPEQNRLYLTVPHRGAQRAEIRVYEARD
jgi:DNA-binding beta-propeller fold protein YncE